MTVGVQWHGQAWRGAASKPGTPTPDPTTTYRVMSITKTMTAVLVLRAADEGRLRLDAPLPALIGVDAPLPDGLTPRDLLRHRSGFVDYTLAPGYQPDVPITPEHAIELTLRAGLSAPPDTVTRYVNSNFLYLGLLVQQLEQRPFADLVTQLVAPYGLHNTRVDPPGRPGWAGFSSGGVNSDVAEMAAWGAALFAPGKVLSAADLALMTSIGEGRTGLGMWGMCPCGSSPTGFTAFGHPTAAGGLFYFPDIQMVVVMRADVSTGDTTARAISLGTVLRAALVA